MVLRSRHGYRTSVPSVTSTKAQTKQLSYTGGVDTYTDNDDVKPNTLVYATDARQVKRGRYKTRKGATRYSVPVGEAVSASQTSTAGAAVKTVNGFLSVAEKLTASSTGVLTMSEVRIRTTASSVGTLLVEYYSNNAGVPGTLLATSSILPASVTSSFTYIASYFMTAPAVTSGDILWMVIRGQDDNVGDYEISTTTNTTNALTRSGAGSWVAAAYSLNARMSVSPANAVKGVYRAYRYNGLNKTMFAASGSLYTVDDVTGAPTSIHSGMNAAATRYRFDMAQDSVYFVNGYEKPFKYDLTAGTVASVTTALATALTCMEHKGCMFYVNADDPSQAYYSNFGLYDTFTSTDFLTFGSPKSPHKIVALAKLNGALYAFARKNKFVLLGDSNATWSIDEAIDQRGTFTQESVAFNENYIFHADTDGIHQFNGTDSRNLAEKFLEDYRAIPSKDGITLELHNNRLYVFYAPAGQAVNTQCLVYNLLLDVYEGLDLDAYVGRAFARFAQDDIFIQGSNRTAALYYGESTSNSYDNLGAPLSFELRTAYDHFGSPAQRKRVPKWRPSFGSVAANYSIEAGYSFDHQLDATYLEIPLTTGGATWDSGELWDSGFTFAATGGLIEPTNLFIPGEFKRLQRRYRHVAAHEPVEVDSEILAIETQRLN